MTAYWCELAWLGGEAAVAGVRVEVAGGRITSVSPGAEPDGAVGLAGLTLPGLANGHSHAFHRALRARAQGPGSFWTWREAMYGVAATLTPESYAELAASVYREMVAAGVTTVGEFHYVHHQPDGTPYDDPNAMSAALVAAAGEAGVRLTLLDTCYLRAEGVQRRFSDVDAERWAERASAKDGWAGVRTGAAIHSVRAVPPEAIELVAAWAAQRGAPLHAHVSEQPAENEACLATYGCTPTQLLEPALNDRFVAVHAVHTTAADHALLGAAGACVCVCPTTERDLADGVVPARALRDAGARLAVGSDSHAVVDLFEEARAVELDERLVTGSRGLHTTASLLEAATNHAALGWPDAGRIEAGALADLVTIGFDSPRLEGTDASNALDAAVYAAGAADVRHVVLGGKVVVG